MIAFTCLVVIISVVRPYFESIMVRRIISEEKKFDIIKNNRFLCSYFTSLRSHYAVLCATSREVGSSNGILGYHTAKEHVSSLG